MTENPSQTLEALFDRLITRHDERSQQERRSDDEVWRKYKRSLETRHVLGHLQPKTISVEDDEVEFRHAWRNGLWHCLEPVSFDLLSADSIRDKAHRWLGQVSSVSGSPDRFKIYLLLGEPQQAALRPAFEKAVSIQGSRHDLDTSQAEYYIVIHESHHGRGLPDKVDQGWAEGTGVRGLGGCHSGDRSS